jgi:hypothetical protein
MRATIISRRDTRPLTRHPGTGGPGQQAVRVVACLVIPMVFVVIAAPV